MESLFFDADCKKKKIGGKDDLKDSSERTSFQILVGRAIYP